MPFPINPEVEDAITKDINEAIQHIVKRHLGKSETRAVVDETTKVHEEGYRIGKYLIEQLPYASLEDIRFPSLPKGEGGKGVSPTEQTERVQKYGPLVNYWIGDPYSKHVDEEYTNIPIGFPVQFAQKRYPNEGFQQWRTHNGVKAIRIEYEVFPGEDEERPAHLTVFYSGGDH